MRRVIRPNHSEAQPSAHVVVDTETTPVPCASNAQVCIHTLRLGIARHWRMEAGRQTRLDNLHFRDWNTFWNWLESKLDGRRPLWVWAHNLAFDLTALRFWELLECGDFSFEAKPGGRTPESGDGPRKVGRAGALVTQDPPTVVIARHKSGSWVRMYDSMNWAPESLAAIGQAVGLAKLQRPGELADERDWLEYCERDVDILERFVLELLAFARENGLGMFCGTAASQAMHWWRHSPGFRPLEIEVEPETKALERKCYYAGFHEVYYNGNVLLPNVKGMGCLAGADVQLPTLWGSPVYNCDVTGAYPHAMQVGNYPVRYLRTDYDVPPKRLEGQMRYMGGAAWVTLESVDRPYPLRRPDGTVWAIGKYETALCGPELLEALQEGHVKLVHVAQLYEMGRPFAKWIDEAWKVRMRYRAENRPLFERLVKLLMNSLHGKIGQRCHTWELVPGIVAPCEWGTYPHYCQQRKCTVTRRSVGFTVQEQMDGAEPASSSPIVSAYVAAYCRQHIRSLRLIAGLRDCLYCNVDSLHVTQAGYERLKVSGCLADCEMGRLKLVEQADVATYWGVGDYRLGDKRVRPGLSRRAVSDPKGLWHQTNFLKLDSVLNGRPAVGPSSFDREIPPPSGQIRGRVNLDGWVDPLLVRH